MSSCPGYDLEDLLAWNFDLVIEGQDDANTSLGIAELLGTAIKRRPRLNKEQFAPIVAMYEPVRELAEYKLLEYEEEDHGSWRDYACYSFDEVLTDDRQAKVEHYLKDISWSPK